MKYAIIEGLWLHHIVKTPCNQMDLSESGYYAWRPRARSHRQHVDTKLKVIDKAAHIRTKETCGHERLHSVTALKTKVCRSASSYLSSKK